MAILCLKCKIEKSEDCFRKSGINRITGEQQYKRICKPCNPNEPLSKRVKFNNETGFKTCYKCRLEKTLDQFSKDKSAKDGKCPYCKECRNKSYVKYAPLKRQWSNLHYHNNKKKILIKQRAKKARFPWINMYIQAKIRAKKNNLPFNITLEDVISVWPKDNMCPILKIPFKFDNKKAGLDSPSLDKVIPENGYTVGNIAIISHYINLIKRDVTDPNIFRKIADYQDSFIKNKGLNT